MSFLSTSCILRNIIYSPYNRKHTIKDVNLKENHTSVYIKEDFKINIVLSIRLRKLSDHFREHELL